jgi:F-type H+-transporting ATPase subunit a
MRKHLYVFFAVLLAATMMAPSAQAAEGETLDIVGHAADGYYLAFEPLGKPELPRIFLMENADGEMTLQAYATTKSALKSGAFNLTVESDGGTRTLTSASEIDEAVAAKKHLYGSLQPKQGSIILDFSITRHLLYGLLAMLATAFVFISLANRYKRGVGREEAPRGIFQNMFEAMIVYVRDDIAKPTIGEEKYEKFLPYLLTAFFFILFANLFGLVPYGAAATSNLAITGMLALFTFVIGQVYGSKEHWKHLLMGPEGIPWWVRPILVPVEILGLFTRHLALAIRLFANMLAGALVIFSLLGLIFIVNVVFGAGVAYGAAVPSIGLTVFILLVKTLVAFIQAYVFTMLSALFIGMAVEEHHDHDDEHDSESRSYDTGELTPAFGSGDGTVEQRTRPETPEPVTS